MLRSSAKRPLLASYGLAALFFIAGATRIGYQDIGALMAQRGPAPERVREHIASSPLGALHTAALGLPRPLGTLIPEPESVKAMRGGAGFVNVNRSGKGDLLVPRLQIEITADLLREDAAASRAHEDEGEELERALDYKPFPAHDLSLSLELHPRAPTALAARPAVSPDETAEGDDAQAMLGATQLYFDSTPMLPTPAGIIAWDAGEAPVVVASIAGPAVAVAPTASPQRADEGTEEFRKARRAAQPEAPAPREAKRLHTPAEQLGLTVKTRARAEKCLANAIYFEARSEPVRGQVAVAQVVLNRAFSDYYPEDICGVVYQGARRYLSCQFTFACDGIPDVVTEQEPWDRAKKIASAILDGKIWLKDVGKATHYHASYVNPYWVRSMRRLQKIGLHSFYRPRNWGDGRDEFSWGSSGNTELAGRF